MAKIGDPSEHRRYRCESCGLRIPAARVVVRKRTLNLSDSAIIRRGFAYIFPTAVVCECGHEMLLEHVPGGRIYR